MGSMISLGVGKMEIDWGKNNMFRDHSALFTDGDIKDIPYYYAGPEENEIITEYHEGFSRNLSLIKRRLDLLGYSLKKVEKLYNDALYECSEYGYNLDLSFDSFSKMLRELDISKIDTPGFQLIMKKTDMIWVSLFRDVFYRKKKSIIDYYSLVQLINEKLDMPWKSFLKILIHILF